RGWRRDRHRRSPAANRRAPAHRRYRSASAPDRSDAGSAASSSGRPRGSPAWGGSAGRGCACRCPAAAGSAWRRYRCRALRPGRPGNPAGKFANYECGLDPVGGDWAQAQIRYYLYAYLYVLFAVESVLLFPWAVVFALPGFGRTAVVEMGIFVGVLALGLL